MFFFDPTTGLQWPMSTVREVFVPHLSSDLDVILERFVKRDPVVGADRDQEVPVSAGNNHLPWAVTAQDSRRNLSPNVRGVNASASSPAGRSSGQSCGFDD